jgi:hypothetical protein
MRRRQFITLLGGVGEEGASGMNTTVYSLMFAQQHQRSGIEE